jgi:hypothetical protein
MSRENGFAQLFRKYGQMLDLGTSAADHRNVYDPDTLVHIEHSSNARSTLPELPAMVRPKCEN